MIAKSPYPELEELLEVGLAVAVQERVQVDPERRKEGKCGNIGHNIDCKHQSASEEHGH